MIHLAKGLAVLAALACTTTASNAQDLGYWGSISGWDVMVDPTLGDGCLIQAEYNDGSTVRIGFDRTNATGYVTVFNDAWGDIEEGEAYPIEFALDGELYEGVAHGIYLAGVPGADVVFDNPDFMFDIAKKYTMTLYHDGYEVMAIDLEGTFNGLEAALQCQDDYG